MYISTIIASRPKLSDSLFRILGVLFAILLLGLPAAAHELGIDLSKIPVIRKNPLLPDKDFLALTKKVVEVDPYNEGKISYSMRLPKNWTDNSQHAPTGSGSGKSLLSGNVLSIVAKYSSAPKNLVRSYVVIEAQTLTYEISAKNWFVNFILSNGFSLTALTEKDPRQIEALYIQVNGDQTYVVRTRVVFNGPNLIIIRYYLPQENYDEEKALQEQIMSSFTLLTPTNERIEKQSQYGFLDQSYFNFPESWTLKEKSIFSVERMSALLYQINNGGEKRMVLDGQLRINVISKLLKTTLAQEIADFRAKLDVPNYSVGKLVEEVKYYYDPSIRSGRAQIYRLIPSDPVNLKDYELLVTVMEGDDYYYITSMITPSRSEDFYTWAQNMETARIVNESVRRHNVSLEYDPNDPYFDYMKEAQ